MTGGQQRTCAILNEIVLELARYPERPPEFYWRGDGIDAYRSYAAALFLQSICRDVRSAIKGDINV